MKSKRPEAFAPCAAPGPRASAPDRPRQMLHPGTGTGFLPRVTGLSSWPKASNWPPRCRIAGAPITEDLHGSGSRTGRHSSAGKDGSPHVPCASPPPAPMQVISRHRPAPWPLRPPSQPGATTTRSPAFNDEPGGPGACSGKRGWHERPASGRSRWRQRGRAGQ